MAKILYAWELGGELGHITRALPIALAARERGHEPILALRDLSRAEAVLGRHGLTFVQAPVWLPPLSGLPQPPLNYTEILFGAGYLDFSGLLGMVRAWRALYALSSADLVMADYAPTALLAAHSMGIARAMCGNGFFSPPRSSPLPNMRPWLNVPIKRLEAGERAVVHVINRVLFELGSAPLGRTADLLVEERSDFLLTFPELDHYRGRAKAEYMGPVMGFEEGAEPVWPEGEGAKVFAYLKPAYPHFDKVLSALASSEARVLVYAGRLPRAVTEKYGTKIRFSPTPYNIASAGKGCDAAVCHAGHGTVSAMLLAGRPMLLLPMHLEQLLIGRRVAELGAGLYIEDNRWAGDFNGALARLLDDPSYAELARSFSGKYRGKSPKETVSEIIGRCEEIIACRKKPRQEEA